MVRAGRGARVREYSSEIWAKISRSGDLSWDGAKRVKIPGEREVLRILALIQPGL